MAALTKNAGRTRVGLGQRFRDPVAAGARIFEGSLVALNASGDAIKAIPTATRVRARAATASETTIGSSGCDTDSSASDHPASHPSCGRPVSTRIGGHSKISFFS